MLGLEMLIIIVKTINYIEHWSQAWFGREADAKTTTQFPHRENPESNITHGNWTDRLLSVKPDIRTNGWMADG